MNKAILFNFEVERENNLIKVERSFQAPNDLVWAAWTEADILDQWWAPKPWQAGTKSMDFREGGRWHYYMQGPEGDKHWCIFDYREIRPLSYYSGIDAFCDENAVANTTMPRTEWKNTFTADGDNTVVNVTMRFEKLEDLENIIQMGFKEGFTAGLENLDQYIAAQFYLRKKNKTSNRARVTAYINLPGNTEEAFTFYKSVLKTDFVNGIKRFSEFSADPNHAPMAEEVKNMVLHVELPLLGDFVLMGTDAPKEMGFTLASGNNMHISLEPATMEEATRLFTELSAGGEIEMPLQEMFYGAYYAGFTDKYGINWMINYQNN